MPWAGTPCAATLVPAPHPSADDITAAATVLAGARNAVIITGGGSRGAAAELRVLAERLGAPVVTTCNGKGVLPEDHPLSAGASIRLTAAHEFIASAAVALVVGSELGDSDLWDGTLRSETVIRLDIDPGQLDKNRVGQHHLLGDAGRDGQHIRVEDDVFRWEAHLFSE